MLDVDEIQSLLNNNKYELVIAILSNNKHPVIEEIKAYLANSKKRKLPQDLYIEHLKLSDTDVIEMIGIIRKKQLSDNIVNSILIILGISAILLSFYGLVLLFNGDGAGAKYLCALPSGIFLIIIAKY